MANTFAPQGFRPVRRSDGAAWTAALQSAKIAAANAHHFFCGDPVVLLSTGYIDDVAPGSLPTQGIFGIFINAEYLSTSQGRKVWNNQVNGDMAADALAHIITDPSVIFRVWVGASGAGGGPAVQGDIGENFSFQQGTGNSLSGISGAYLDYASKNTTNTLPFVLDGLVTDPPGMNGSDTTTAGNLVEVVFNQSARKVGTTGV